jgi:hypothetical protein
MGVTGGYAVQVTTSSTTIIAHFETDLSSPSGDDQYLALQFPLTVGKAWSYTIAGTYAGQAMRWTITRKVEDTESVTVPAGTFDTLRIAGRHCNNYGGCGNYVSWYAPKARQTVKITWNDATYWPARVKGLTQALLSYQLNNP